MPRKGKRGVDTFENRAVPEMDAVEYPYRKATLNGITHDAKSPVSVASSRSNGIASSTEN
jgi:hypothetical protein